MFATSLNIYFNYFFMQRNLIFRVWDDTDKKWLLGYEYPNLNGFSIMGETMLFGEYQGMLNSFKLTDWDRIKIMQYTGLKDSNGKKIYEGDIIKVKDVVNRQIIYVEDDFTWYAFKLPKIEEDTMPFPIRHYQIHIDTKICVIGNIYENPELLLP